MKNATNKSVVIVSHKYVTHPDDELVVYLNKQKYSNVLHICHSFSDAPDRKSYYRWYSDGKLVKKTETRDYSFLPEPLIYIKEFVFTFRWLLISRIEWDNYIGMDGLCCAFGLVSKKLRFCKKVIFWAIDFVPKGRFGSNISNFIYQLINKLSYTKVDEIWDLSPRMNEAREKYLKMRIGAIQIHRIVPYGVWLDKIKIIPYKKAEQQTIVFMGHIKENQGAQLVLPVLKKLITSHPSIQFKVIGDGPYLNTLKNMARELGVDKRCKFLGRIENHEVVESEIAKSAVAVAPYIKALDKWTYYADPGKVKTYLACGVPVIMTDLPWNANDIQLNKCGIVIDYDEDDMYQKIKRFLKPANQVAFRRNARLYAEKFDYNEIFSTILS